MSTKPLVLVLGSGPRVGAAVVQAFLEKGYNVAVAARQGNNTKDDQGVLSLKADFNDPNSIPDLFKTVESEFNTFPSVIIYNAVALTPPQNNSSPLSIPPEALANNLNVNVISPFVAAHVASEGWSKLDSATNKVFIYTGNIQNQVVLPVPLMLSLGIGKAAAGHWIEFADKAFSPKGYR
jgi:NAD(P)-dependent dehydrogenase (short-subunit alcohol dehydrogenase family)